MPASPIDTPTAAAAAPARLLYTVREAQRLLSLSHATLYRLLATGELTGRKIGTRTYIPAASIEAFLAALPAVQVRSTPAP
jgi:excisionase family DNA binding protein